MRETISMDEVEVMLDAAYFHLDRLNAEHQKMSGRDPRALKAFIYACLVLGTNVFYTLTNSKEYVDNPFRGAAGAWKTELQKRPEDDAFFNRMLHHRDFGVHISVDPTEAAVSSVSAYLDPSIQVFSAPAALMAASDPQGNPSQALVFINKFKIDGEDARERLRRYLTLLSDLVQQCKSGALRE